MKCNGAFVVALAVIVTVLSTCARSAAAHGVDPIGVAIVEKGDGDVRVRIDRPASLAGAALAVGIDADCAENGAATRTVTSARAIDDLSLHCARTLAGRTVRIDGLATAGLDAVFRAELLGGTIHRSVVTAQAPSVALPSASNWLRSLAAFLGLGAKHLLFGFDHLLFVLGTLLLERRPRRAVLALTGFTIGHSLTLCAAASGMIHVPPAMAEVGIALSLVWLAVAIARSEGSSTGYRLAAVTMVVGLVHGLGFATGLADAGMPTAELPLALVGFNVGIELTQLALVAVAFGLAGLAARARMQPPEATRSWLAHGIGGLAIMWCVERVLAA